MNDDGIIPFPGLAINGLFGAQRGGGAGVRRPRCRGQGAGDRDDQARQGEDHHHESGLISAGQVSAPAAGQIFGASGDNLILYSQPRPIETLTSAEGWTPETIISEAFVKMAPKFFPLSRPAPQAASRATPRF